RRRHTRSYGDWSSDVCSSDLAMTRFRKLESRTLVIARADIDTDQIIPARFLKGTTRAGLGAHLFADWPERPDARGAQVLVAGAKIGRASCRERVEKSGGAVVG